ncbi:MAG: phosphoenolpyruvate carboxykinase (GTP) [Bdellovibrionales bacterium]|nr:phosphoenolpyruvate carboxykinase (GTP) [Bdellovibrionales bacterium]
MRNGTAGVTMECSNPHVHKWVRDAVELLEPREVVWIDGSTEQFNSLCALLEQEEKFVRLDEKEYPNSYWYRSDPSDVARVEGCTFICSTSEADCGPTNNWAEPSEMKQRLYALMKGSMQGKTLYVLPYLMGPAGSPYSKMGFELTDSRYVVVNMSIMARTGKVALEALADDNANFIKGLHALGSRNPEERYICHFPETREIISFNTGYGGNALQGKKCFALRIASSEARREGWMAEHMLILGLTNPAGEKRYVCAAFPSACGKTNLAMLVPPESYLKAGWKVETVGDDIAWLNFGSDGRLYAINPEAGFFGVAPGTSRKTNPNMIDALKKGNCIFTNTALDLDANVPWWEGVDGEQPTNLRDWLGKDTDHESGTPYAHPNSRFTCPASQCPCIDAAWESAQGVPIDAIIFGGRRAKAAPLVYEAFDWQHGTFVGATMASERTAAAAGKVGELTRDPMAMKPFIGYHVGDYFKHWLAIGSKSGAQLPKIFHVNWFRTDTDGRFIWPGFGDNMRVLDWILKRVSGSVNAVETALGFQPQAADLDLEELGFSEQTVEALLAIRPEEWATDLESQLSFFQKIGDKLPSQLMDEHRKLRERLGL